MESRGRARPSSAGRRWLTIVESLAMDARLAARRLRRTPGFAAVTVAALGLGIGASTAIFSTVRPVLFAALPYPEPDRLVAIADAGGTAGPVLDLTFGTYREIAARSRSLAAATVMRTWQPTLTGLGDAERLDGQSVTADYFRVLGAGPALGRDFSPADDLPGAPAVAIVSDGLWRRGLGADPDRVGRPLVLDGAPVTVIGVMPPGFENLASPDARIWRPLAYDPSLPADGREWGHHLQMLARIAAGSDLDGVRRELASLAGRPVPAFSRPEWASLDGGFVVTPFQDQITMQVRPALRAVIGATGLLLLIAVVNVVSLVVARGLERRRELATCAAFGASRWRLLRPLLAEGLLLAGVGGSLGVVLAYALVDALVALDGFVLPRAGAIRVDRQALAFAAMLAGGIGLVAGCAPGLSVSARASWWGPGVRVIAGHRRLRRGFVAAEVAVAVVLLVGAGLLLRTMQHLLSVPVGFRADGVLTLQVQTSGLRFRDAEDVRRFSDEVRASVQRIPGVLSVGLTSQLPLSGDADVYGVGTQEDFRLPADADRGAFRYGVTPGYLEAMAIPLVAGRAIDAGDRPGGPPVALVSARLAGRRFPDREAVGERIRIGGNDLLHTIVGVVGDVTHASFAGSPAEEAVYVPQAQWPFADRALWVVVLTSRPPGAMESEVRAAIGAVDPDQPVSRVAAMAQRVAAATARPRFVMRAFEVFAAAALLLATIGIYGVLAGSVVERAREIALRAAVGASRAAVVRLVLRQAGGMTAAGLAVGLGGALVMSRSLAVLLFEVAPVDRATYVGASALLLAAAGLGALVPAWRAAAISPAAALRPD